MRCESKTWSPTSIISLTSFHVRQRLDLRLSASRIKPYILYTLHSLLELRRRFEAPNEKNRWDFPLFRVYTVPLQSEVLLGATEGSDQPIDQVGDISCSEKVLKCDRTEAVTTPSGTTTVEKPVPQTLTSTKGQIDINCLAVEKTVNIPFRSDKAPEEPLKPISSSWRPKVRSEAKAVSNRTFVSLGGETNSFADTASTHTVCSIDPSVLSISGSIPMMIANDQQSDPQEVMHQMYLHLTNVSQIAAPNSSTISVLRVNADLLHLLDRTSQLITQRIVAHQAENVEGDSLHDIDKFSTLLLMNMCWDPGLISLFGSRRHHFDSFKFLHFVGTPLIFQDFDRTLALHRHVGLAELQRHRRQFVKTHSNMPASASTSLGSSFIDCLATYL
jgi:Chromatin associated protein KTI12